MLDHTLVCSRGLFSCGAQAQLLAVKNCNKGRLEQSRSPDAMRFFNYILDEGIMQVLTRAGLTASDLH